MEAEFFYGLSGTFKGTTINKRRLTSDPVLWSEIKTWKSLESGIFRGQASERNDINYAMLHLCNLEQLLKNIKPFEMCQSWKIFIERGVSDMAYYYLKNGGHGEKTWLHGEGWITDAVQEEMKVLLLTENIDSIHKTLLVQKDIKFIEDTVFNELSRQAEFVSVDHYLIEQEKYVDFTMKYNNIDEVIEITDAEDYITNTLGLEFKKQK